MHDIRRAGRFIVSPVFKFQFRDSRSRSTMKQSATVSGCHARAALPACVFGHASMPWSRASQYVHRMRARFAEPPQVLGNSRSCACPSRRTCSASVVFKFSSRRRLGLRRVNVRERTPFPSTFRRLSFDRGRGEGAGTTSGVDAPERFADFSCHLRVE
jgi:hypothetical protein